MFYGFYRKRDKDYRTKCHCNTIYQYQAIVTANKTE